jgi:glycosyltransferase involved in cell wall biosynthesis
MLSNIKLIPIFIKVNIKKVSYRISAFFCLIADFFSCLISLNKKSEDLISPKNAEKFLKDLWPDTGSYPETIENQEVDENLDLSIIIPAYNVEKYINECLDSIFNQPTNYNFEVLLVDDGSTDNTLKILNEYNDERLKIFEQENAGQAVAKNRALSIAKGKYIMFVDADDFLFDNAINILMEVAYNDSCDIVEGKVIKFYDKESIDMPKYGGEKFVTSYNEKPKYFLNKVGYSPAKVYKKELWNDIRFPEGYIFEGIINKFILRRKAKRYAQIDAIIYAYRTNLQSTTRGQNYLKKLDCLWVGDKGIEIHEKFGLQQEDVFYLLLLNHLGVLNYIISTSFDEETKKAIFSFSSNKLMNYENIKPKRIPFMFLLLYKSMKKKNYNAWIKIAYTITKHQLLKKWREVN